MLRDGRLRTACEGKMVDVRSIAEYLERPQARASRARYAKRAARGAKTSQWRVAGGKQGGEKPKYEFLRGRAEAYHVKRALRRGGAKLDKRRTRRDV